MLLFVTLLLAVARIDAVELYENNFYTFNIDVINMNIDDVSEILNSIDRDAPVSPLKIDE